LLHLIEDEGGEAHEFAPTEGFFKTKHRGKRKFALSYSEKLGRPGQRKKKDNNAKATRQRRANQRPKKGPNPMGREGAAPEPKVH